MFVTLCLCLYTNVRWNVYVYVCVYTLMYITKMHIMNDIARHLVAHLLTSFLTLVYYTHSTYLCSFIADSKGRLFPLFSSSQHGESFSTLVGRIVKQGPVLLVIRDTGGNVFGGFASQSWTISPEFTGNDTLKNLSTKDVLGSLFYVLVTDVYPIQKSLNAPENIVLFHWFHCILYVNETSMRCTHI